MESPTKHGDGIMIVWGFGSRKTTHPDPRSLVYSIMRRYFNADDVLVSGSARGIDTYMEDYVSGIHVGEGTSNIDPLEPDWSKGGGAALKRNVINAQKCDRAIGIWSVASSTGKMVVESSGIKITMNRSGTLHSIVQTIRYGKPLVLCIVLPNGMNFILHVRSDLGLS